MFSGLIKERALHPMTLRAPAAGGRAHWPITVEQFSYELGVHHTLLMASPNVEKQFGGILGIPTKLLIDRHRRIRKKSSLLNTKKLLRPG